MAQDNNKFKNNSDDNPVDNLGDNLKSPDNISPDNLDNNKLDSIPGSTDKFLDDNPANDFDNNLKNSNNILPENLDNTSLDSTIGSSDKFLAENPDIFNAPEVNQINYTPLESSEKISDKHQDYSPALLGDDDEYTTKLTQDKRVRTIIYIVFTFVSLILCIGVLLLLSNFSGNKDDTKQSCDYQNTEYNDGTQFEAYDGCSICQCNDGEVTCKDDACPSQSVKTTPSAAPKTSITPKITTSPIQTIAPTIEPTSINYKTSKLLINSCSGGESYLYATHSPELEVSTMGQEFDSTHKYFEMIIKIEAYELMIIYQCTDVKQKSWMDARQVQQLYSSQGDTFYRILPNLILKDIVISPYKDHYAYGIAGTQRQCEALGFQSNCYLNTLPIDNSLVVYIEINKNDSRKDEILQKADSIVKSIRLQ